MKAPLSWLKEYLQTDASLAMIAERLTALGLEVEQIEERGAALADFTVAEIIATTQHPNADRLKLCQVNLGDNKMVSVVCGAANARAGIKIPYAKEGVVIPASGQALKAASIRGVVSEGMLCSERELNLKETMDGIMELPAACAVGQNLRAVLGLDDPVLHLKLTPNRPDCTGIYGLARDLAASNLGKLQPIQTKEIKVTAAAGLNVALETEICPYFTGRLIIGVSNGESPPWLKARLEALGLRPISALVDITNYFSFAYGRPLHVFDADKIKGTLRVRESVAGEFFAALNGETITLAAGHAVLADDSGVLGLAGVMGGASSGCTAETKNVFLEVAYFEPRHIARAGRSVNLTSDARYRFERGVDPAFLPVAEKLATAMILDLCGGEAAATVLLGNPPAWQREIFLRENRCATLGGLFVPAPEQKQYLEALGFTLKEVAGGFMVTPPSFRPDILGEADLIEEILRLKGYDALISEPLPPVAPPQVSAHQAITMQVRRAMAAQGLLECVTYSFMDKEVAKFFAELPQSLQLLNPIAADLNQMRPSILPNLLSAAQRNADRGFPDVSLFEVGPVYFGQQENEQEMQLAILRQADMQPRHWQIKGERQVDIYRLRADAELALQAAGVNLQGLQVKAEAPSHYHPGQSGALFLGPLCLAHFGALHPKLAKQLGQKYPCMMAEIYLSHLPSAAGKASAANQGSAAKQGKSFTRPAFKPSPLMPLVRDFAFVMEERMAAAEIIAAIRKADRALIVGVDVFDVYTGKAIEPGKKSMALAVHIQPQDKSLTDEELAALSDKIVQNVSALGVHLR